MLTPRERRRMIIAQVCDHHGVAVEEVMGRSRFKRICTARKEAYAMLREERLSYPTIGRMFGRDHTTVVDGVQRYRRDQNEDDKQESDRGQPEQACYG
jgi:chromosomal replication initiation ATPase DnaA